MEWSSTDTTCVQQKKRTKALRRRRHRNKARTSDHDVMQVTRRMSRVRILENSNQRPQSGDEMSEDEEYERRFLAEFHAMPYDIPPSLNNRRYTIPLTIPREFLTRQMVREEDDTSTGHQPFIPQLPP